MRRDHGEGVALVVRELSGGDVARAPQLGGLNHRRERAFNGLTNGQLAHLQCAGAADDFGSEGEHFEAIVQDGGAVGGGEPGHAIDVTLIRLDRERWRHGV